MRPITDSLPPPPKDPTDIPVLDAYRWGRWPHLFMLLARHYNAPPELLLVLLYLWDTTVGSGEGTDKGNLALSQIPVNARHKNKWVLAFLRAGFFEREKAGPHDREGSRYYYEKTTTPEQWEDFFAMAEFLNGKKKWDNVSKEEFAAMFAPAMLNDITTLLAQHYSQAAMLKKMLERINAAGITEGK